jgi:O-antigen/teichoic acid export membrane protein
MYRVVGSQWVSVFFSATAAFFLMMFFARMMPPERLAVYLYLQTLASFYAIVQDGGFQLLVFREQVSPSRSLKVSVQDLISSYFGYVLLCSVLGMAMVIFLPMDDKGGLILAIAFFGFKCVINIISSVLKGRGLFEKEAFWKIQVNALLALSVVLTASFTPLTPEKIFVSFIAAQMAMLAVKQARSHFNRPKFSFPPWRIWKTCIALIIINAATTVYFKCDIILLRRLQPDLSLTGNYGAAFQLLEGIILFSTPVIHICFRFLRLGWSEKRLFLIRFKKLMIGALLTAFVIVATAMPLASKIVLIAYGKQYIPAGNILRLLIVSLVFIFPNYILTQAMIALNQERYYAAASCLCAVFNIALNLILIPHFLTSGAAFSTIATEALLTFILGCRLYMWSRDDV